MAVMVDEIHRQHYLKGAKLKCEITSVKEAIKVSKHGRRKDSLENRGIISVMAETLKNERRENHTEIAVTD
ncbi:MAG: hypothetical protein ACETWT_05825 [Thermodesulfobacteriota bacterium]|jgi:hypothetical protein